MVTLSKSFTPESGRWNNDLRLDFFGTVRTKTMRSQRNNVDSSVFYNYSQLSLGGKVRFLALCLTYFQPSFTRLDLAAIIGNGMQESNLDPRILNKSSGAFGLFQWLSSNRVSGLLEQVNFNFSDPWSLLNPILQIRYAIVEDNINRRWIIDVIRADSLEDKVYQFADKFEGVIGSGSEDLDKRVKKSKQALSYLSSF